MRGALRAPPARRPRALAWLRALLPAPPAVVMALPRGERLVLALTGLGPIFVKFGQILSTRRDLLPADVADALTQLQDRVAPFPAALARAAIERAQPSVIVTQTTPRARPTRATAPL